jgi:hypothetical protein
MLLVADLFKLATAASPPTAKTGPREAVTTLEPLEREGKLRESDQNFLALLRSTLADLEQQQPIEAPSSNQAQAPTK